MNNKVLGTSFEEEMCEYFANRGFWVHFLVPDSRGAQPFDIIAVKNGRAIAIECKTLADNKRYFTMDRLEDNQMMAFWKWKSTGNPSPIIAIKHHDDVVLIGYEELMHVHNGRLDMKEAKKWDLAKQV